MRKSYKFKKKTVTEKKFNCNYQIKVPEVMVIDEEGVTLGTLETRDAIKLSEEKGLDLVEVSPVANPPVCKIMDYGSFQYQKEKAAKKQKSQGKSLDVKSVRLSMKIGDHDKETKVKQADKFLGKGHKLKIELIFRGRERAHLDIGKDLIKEFITHLSVPTQIEQATSKQGNKLFTILIPDNK
jgi:translation initiation factor IF-3